MRLLKFLSTLEYRWGFPLMDSLVLAFVTRSDKPLHTEVYMMENSSGQRSMVSWEEPQGVNSYSVANKVL